MPPRLLLIGGGHSHLVALREFACRPKPALDITLVSRDIHSLYSGMLPGAIAGHYTIDEACIHLPALCQQAGAHWRQATVNAIDAESQTVSCEQGTSLDYDVVSIDTGSSHQWPGIDRHPSLLPVKPVASLYQRWQQLRDRVIQRLRASATATARIATVGAGAAGVEVVLAMYHALQQLCGEDFKRIQWHVLSAAPDCLGTHNPRVQAQIRRELLARGFELTLAQHIDDISPHATGLRLSGPGGSWLADEVLLATPAGGQSWLADSSLATTADGFLRVNRHLQSVSHGSVFAAGDIAHFDPQPLPKSGVYAVRQGTTLATNLLQQLRQKPLHTFRPQRRFLSLVSLGERRALASRGILATSGKWVWHWKDHIDRRFLRQFPSPTATLI